MKTAMNLRTMLKQIDRKGYPAYKSLAGRYDFGEFVLSIDHVQGDPFASPSDISIYVPQRVALFEKEWYRTRAREIALEDHILRRFYQKVSKYSFLAKGSGKSGAIYVSRPGQEILERSACAIESSTGNLALHLKVGFPANGRTIHAGELEKILFDYLPDCVEQALKAKAYRTEELEEVMLLTDRQEYIRREMKQQGIVAFVADGSILPRESGVSELPMKSAKPFYSPKHLCVQFVCPDKEVISGMAIRKGITLIAGGGYHGKSTLLKAIERGVYSHIKGDGREYVLTEESAVKLRSEDGRSIQGVDISNFIKDLPNKKDTTSFVTEDASGSTSQAANVMEAIEAGSRLFLIDEDTSATNFMIRDELMQMVIDSESEPITPYIDRMEQLYQELGISTILVAGSCGAYFHKADTILQMKEYEPFDITEFAKEKAESFKSRESDKKPLTIPVFQRKVSSAQRFRDRIKVKTMGLDSISIDKEIIDVRYLEQIANEEQLQALGVFFKYLLQYEMDGKKDMRQLVEGLYDTLETEGMKSVYGGNYLPMGLCMPRKQEMYACINRYRKLRVQGSGK